LPFVLLLIEIGGTPINLPPIQVVPTFDLSGLERAGTSDEMDNESEYDFE
jgi:hypothetical protein